MESVRYAIVDGAIVDDLVDFLSEHNPPHACLYSEPLQPELIKLAPYLIEVTPEVESWLKMKTSPWGIYLNTTVTMRILRQHLRKYLQVLLPDESKPVIFRFYDPRNVWDFLSVLSEWETHCFLEGIDKIETTYLPTRELSFRELHQRYPIPTKKRHTYKLMLISKEQYLLLEKVFEKRFTEELYELMKSCSPSIESVDKKWTEKLFSYLKHVGITDRRSIDEIAKLLSQRSIHTLNDIPTEYKEILEGTTTPGHYRADRLFLHVYGEIPAWKRIES